jgi:hypothetical protein
MRWITGKEKEKYTVRVKSIDKQPILDTVTEPIEEAWAGMSEDTEFSQTVREGKELITMLMSDDIIIINNKGEGGCDP